MMYDTQLTSSDQSQLGKSQLGKFKICIFRCDQQHICTGVFESRVLAVGRDIPEIPLLAVLLPDAPGVHLPAEGKRVKHIFAECFLTRRRGER